MKDKRMKVICLSDSLAVGNPPLPVHYKVRGLEFTITRDDNAHWLEVIVKGDTIELGPQPLSIHRVVKLLEEKGYLE